MTLGDVARLVLLGGIWGSSFVLIKIGLEAYSPLQMVAARIVIAAVLLTGLVYLRGLRLPSGRATWRALGVMALVSNVIPFFLIIWGEQFISSSLAAILNSTTPLFTAGIAALVLPDEALSAQRTLGIIIGFLGVAVIVGIDPGGGIIGEVAVVIAAASYGVGFVYARRHLTATTEPVRNAAGQLLMAAAVSLPLGVAASFGGAPGTALAPSLSVAALGVVGTGFAYILYYRLVGDIGSTSASFVTYLIPLFGVLLGWLVLDETLGWNTFAGAALVILGITLAERARRASVVPPPVATVAVEARDEA